MALLNIFKSKPKNQDTWEIHGHQWQHGKSGNSMLVGITIAGYLRTDKIVVKLQASLRKYGILSVFPASFVGIITPHCACGNLTTSKRLLFAGIPLVPVMSQIATSPLQTHA